jgi:AraC-like DNA-binding protein
LIEVASTRHLDPHDRLDFWNDLIGATYPGMSVDPARQNFNARLSVWHLGDLRLVRPFSTPAVVTRSPRSQGPQAISKYLIHTLTRGHAVLEQRGRQAKLLEGDMVICASDEVYRFDALSQHEMLVVEIDKATLTQRLPNIDDFVAREISGKLPGTRLVRRFIDSLWLEARESMSEMQRQAHAGILSDVIVASLVVGDVDQTSGGNVLLMRMQDIIAERYGDFDLGPADLASDLGVPLRTLQAAAARSGTTVGRQITWVRLQKAANLLVTCPNRLVTDVALECGFADPSYFARRFQEAFGTSPKRYQRGG